MRRSPVKILRNALSAFAAAITIMRPGPAEQGRSASQKGKNRSPPQPWSADSHSVPATHCSSSLRPARRTCIRGGAGPRSADTQKFRSAPQAAGARVCSAWPRRRAELQTAAATSGCTPRCSADPRSVSAFRGIMRAMGLDCRAAKLRGCKPAAQLPSRTDPRSVAATDRGRCASFVFFAAWPRKNTGSALRHAKER